MKTSERCHWNAGEGLQNSQCIYVHIARLGTSSRVVFNFRRDPRSPNRSQVVVKDQRRLQRKRRQKGNERLRIISADRVSEDQEVLFSIEDDAQQQRALLIFVDLPYCSVIKYNFLRTFA